MSDPRPLVLSVFATFAVGGPQVRFAALANHYGRAWRHAIIAMDGRLDCAHRLSPGLDVCFPEVAVRSNGLLGHVGAFRRTLNVQRPDVLVTHNWGSMEWAMAARASPRLRHVHIEDGFGPDEAEQQLRRRVLTRRIVLGRSTVVVPSVTLLKLATEIWRLPPERLTYVPNGLDLHRFRPPPPSAAQPRSGPARLGTVAALRREKNLPRLLRAARLLQDRDLAFELAIVGDGPERRQLEALSGQLGIDAVVRFPGAAADPAEAYRDLDVFVLSSDTEQMPFSVLEAMATALPVAATGVGDVRHMLAAENQPFVCACDDAALADALARLINDPALRRAVGAANRRKAEADYGELDMFRRYGELLVP